MRRLASVAVLAAISAFVVSAPVSAAVPVSTAKVVIIVGATEGSTSTYRSYADQAYAEAIKYTAKVTKVYSPNATWAKVKAAVAGANIVLYYGHGNGWPSPYTYDAKYTTKDGMGLNDPANLSDNVHKYYGEPSMATLGLAPNAIVLLGNLCYASGNSEPGNTAPSVTVARQRIDNYAAGFIKGGARAVIADGHGGLVSYIRGLFTTGQTIVNLWRTVPDYHGHEASFASTRSPGYTAWSDTDTASAGYYRSLVTKPTITTTAVTNAVGDTGVDPTSLVIPGRALVDAPDTPLLPAATAAALAAAAGDPTLDLPEGTRLRVLALGLPATADTPALLQVQGLDDPTIAGFVPADHLAPKDSRAPVLIGIDSGLARFSPNGDGVADKESVGALFSETVSWTFDVRDHDGTVLATSSGNGREVAATWDGLVAGSPVADGTYTWTLHGTDAWQNGVATGTGTLVVDTTPPSISSISPDAATVNTFSPNGDGVVDTISTVATPTEAGSIAVRVADGSNVTVRTFSVPSSGGATTLTWDGRDNGGAVVPDGEYVITMAARDTVGNGGPGRTRTVRVVTLLGFVASSATLIYPNDLDRFAPTSVLSFRLSRPATVSWTLRNSSGAIVVTHLDNVALPAGSQSWTFDGRRPDGTMLPVGTYTSYVYASDGTFVYAQASRVELDAFAIAPSTTAPKRGAKITITATSAEPLQGTPRLYVTQPGLTTSILTMSRVDSRTFRLTFTLKSGGSAGTLKLKVWARDYDGRTQATTRSLDPPLTAAATGPGPHPTPPYCIEQDHRRTGRPRGGGRTIRWSATAGRDVAVDARDRRRGDGEDRWRIAVVARIPPLPRAARPFRGVTAPDARPDRVGRRPDHARRRAGPRRLPHGRLARDHRRLDRCRAPSATAVIDGGRDGESPPAATSPDAHGRPRRAPAVDPVRARRWPTPAIGRLHAGWTGRRRLHAPSRRPLVRWWRRPDRAAGRSPGRPGDAPRDHRSRRWTRSRPCPIARSTSRTTTVRAFARSACPTSPEPAPAHRHHRSRRHADRPPPRDLRLPAVLGADARARSVSTTGGSRRSPTSGSGRTARATSRSGTATARHRSAGAAGPARR